MKAGGIEDVIGLMGVGLIAFGIAQVHWPAACVVVGAIFLVGAILRGRARAQAQAPTDEDER